MMMSRLMLFAVLMLVCVHTGAETLAAEQVLRRGNGPEPETLDPHRGMGVSSANILRDLYEGLVTEAPDGTLIPGVAERWEISEDGLTYVFHLRRDARWSNGDPVTAQDCVRGLRRSVNPATGSYYAQMLAMISGAPEIMAGELPVEALGAEAGDDHTLVLRLNSPAPYLLGMLTHATTYPIHGPSLEQHGERFARPGNLVSNGAYQLTRWVVQSHVTLDRNPYYWDDAKTTIARVIFYPTEDLNSELKRYRAGELDWTYDVPVTQMPWIRRHIADEFHSDLYLGIYYFGFNLSQPPFKDNLPLRQALSMVIDREIITGRVTGTGEVPAYGWVPPGTANHTTQTVEWADWPMERRLAEARRLYREAGYSEDNPLDVELRYNTHENHRKIAIAIAYMWRQALGVRVRLLNEEFKVFLSTRRLRQYTQVFRAGWIGDYNDAFTFAEILHSGHGMNDQAWSNAEYDALVEASRREPDPQRRRELLQAAERIVMQELPVMPIYYYATKRVIAPHVKGWQPNIMDHHLTRHMRIVVH